MAEVRVSDSGVPRLVVDPMENVLVGSTVILRYLGIDSIVTLYQWVEMYGCPCIKRPDGLWMTTMTAIDQWIWLGAEADLAARVAEGRSRGSYYSKKRRKDMAEKTFGEDSPQAELVRGHHYDAKPKPATVAEGRPSRAGVGGKGALGK